MHDQTDMYNIEHLKLIISHNLRSVKSKHVDEKGQKGKMDIMIYSILVIPKQGCFYPRR